MSQSTNSRSQLRVDTAFESLHMTVAALKSVNSEYIQRAQHAEQSVGVLMKEKLPEELLRELMMLVAGQMDQRAKERAVQQQAVLQATLVALVAATKKDDAAMRQEVQHVVQELTRSLSVMNETQRVNKARDIQSTTTGAR